MYFEKKDGDASNQNAAMDATIEIDVEIKRVKIKTVSLHSVQWIKIYDNSSNFRVNSTTELKLCTGVKKLLE